jgi:hypothetical protein
MTLATFRGSAFSLVLASVGVGLAIASACRSTPYRTFASPEDAVKALTASAKTGTIDDLVAIFGPESRDLVSSNDPAVTKRNREIFVAAVSERWRFEDRGPDSKLLVIGNEDWPFPVPLVRDSAGWRFDTAAGQEEVIARRVGRNELAAILVCRTYIAAQKLYVSRPHDGRPAGAYAQQLRSDPGRENGLYWAAAAGKKRSPLGDLVAQAASDGAATAGAPFHGYYFRLLPSSGRDMPAVVAWPAQYDVTGVMTFVAGADGIVRERDLGTETGTTKPAAPDASWPAVQ